jgi:hypothetical protein
MLVFGHSEIPALTLLGPTDTGGLVRLGDAENGFALQICGHNDQAPYIDSRRSLEFRIDKQTRMAIDGHDRAVSVNGIVESEAGGFKFPDGSIQDTAARGATWHPIQAHLGGLPDLQSYPTRDWKLPDRVPLGAEEVLIYVYLVTEGPPDDIRRSYSIFTKFDAGGAWDRYQLDLCVRNCDGYNSETFWLPVTADRKLYVTLYGGDINLVDSAIQVTGYR